MDASGHQQWLRAAILFGILYLAVGITFAALANTAASNEMRVTWRLAAWLAIIYDALLKCFWRKEALKRFLRRHLGRLTSPMT